MSKDIGGVWRTIGGRKVFIKDGQSVGDAMKESGKFKKAENKGSKTNNKKTNTSKMNNEINDDKRKEMQLEIIKKNNAMTDDYHTGIRTKEDIKSATEAFKTKIDDDEDYLYPDFSKADGLKALETGKITVYSSKEIKDGGFVSPSKMMAKDYAGSGKIYEITVDIKDIAWIDSNEGQFAPIKKKK